jgi:predicted permease
MQICENAKKRPERGKITTNLMHRILPSFIGVVLSPFYIKNENMRKIKETTMLNVFSHFIAKMA